MSVEFEFPDHPNGFGMTNDEFVAIHEIISKDWSRDYTVIGAQETRGPWFLILEKKADGDENAETFYRIEYDGDWGVLFEVPKALRDDTPSLVRRHVNLRVRMATHTFEKIVMDEDQQVVAELVRRGVLDT